MSKILPILTVLFILSFGFVASSHANSMAQNGLKTYDATRLMGLNVWARSGVQLGTIFDLVVDSYGHVDFVIVSQPGFEEFPGRLVVVPFSTLMISKARPHEIRVVFNADKEKFYEGPDYGTENLANLQQAASVDRYYGIQPSWKEGGRTSEDWMLLRILDARRWDHWGERPQNFQG